MRSNSFSGESRSLDESLNDAEYDRLTTILEGFQSENAMNLEEMDGFFAALICGPVAVGPGDQLSEIWGGDAAPFEAMEDLQEFLNLAMRHWNFVAHVLLSSDLVFIPWLEQKEEEELRKGNRWARGFLRGIEVCREDWDEIFADDDKFAMLLPVMALVHENDPDPEMRTWKTPPNADLREKVLVGLSVSAQRLYDYFRPQRQEVRRETTPLRQTKRKIGRNEPCFCGSGKKYKHCCGKVTVN